MSVSVAGPVSGLYLTLPAMLGVLLLGEPLTWAKVVGLLMAVAAIYVLGSDGGEDAGSTAGTCAAEVGSAVVGLLSAQPHDQHGSDDDQPTSSGSTTFVNHRTMMPETILMVVAVGGDGVQAGS